MARDVLSKTKVPPRLRGESLLRRTIPFDDIAVRLLSPGVLNKLPVAREGG